MERSIELATSAGNAGEVPVGAIIINPKGEIIGTGENRRERDRDPTAHAEIVALCTARCSRRQDSKSPTKHNVPLKVLPIERIERYYGFARGIHHQRPQV